MQDVQLIEIYRNDIVVLKDKYVFLIMWVVLLLTILCKLGEALLLGHIVESCPVGK